MPALPNAKHERFVAEYLLDRNGGRAYERAGYKAAGRVADAAASRLLTDVSVAARVAELEAERAERVRVTADDVLDGLLVEAQGAGPDTVSSSRVSAWEKIGKHLGMFVDRYEHTGKDGGPIVYDVIVPTPQGLDDGD